MVVIVVVVVVAVVVDVVMVVVVDVMVVVVVRSGHSPADLTLATAWTVKFPLKTMHLPFSGLNV